MMHIVSRISLVIVTLSAILLMSACAGVINDAGSSQPAAAPAGSEAVPAEALPQPTAAPELEPTAPPEPAATPDPTAPALKMEIVEPDLETAPVSPVLPAAPEEAPEMPTELQSQTVEGESALTEAIAWLSQQLGVPPEQISVISVEQVDWSDTSLGCPQEGYMYAQVITPGYRIILEAQGNQVEVHTNEDGTNVVMCEP